MSFSLKVSNYKVGRTIGQGAFGKVKRKSHPSPPGLTLFFFVIVAVNETLNEPVAFKILNKHKIRKLGNQKKVKLEVKVMKKLQHPHIVCLYQVIDTHSDIFLVMELASGGDLCERINQHGKVSPTFASD